MPSKWAVLVIHGVGEARPGATVDAFVPALAAAHPGTIHPDGTIEVRWLDPDGYPPPPGDPWTVPPQPSPVFPVHLRRADVAAGAGAPARAVFAEVYWADLSRIREGVVHSILALISTIFLIRFVSDQAAVMPDEPKTPPADRARATARWLRAGLFVSALLLNGPISALAMLLAGELVFEDVVAPAVGLDLYGRGAQEALLLGLGLLAGLAGGLARRYGRRANWGSSWIRVARSLEWAGPLFAAAFVARWLLPGGFDRAVAWLAGWVGFTPAMAGAGLLPAVYHGPILLLAAIQGVYVAICVVMVLALFCWLLALGQAPAAWKPGLTVAYGAALLQIALWMLVVPGLALLTIATVVKDPARRDVLGRLFGRIQGGFGLYLIFAMLLGAFAVGVWVHRWRWARDYKGGYVFPYAPDIARLIVNVAIIGALIVLVVSACGYSIATAVFGVRADLFPTQWAGPIAVLIFAPLLGSFRNGLRDWLHIVTDVINHFYRRHDAFPNPMGKEHRPVVRDFEIQQRIEARFRAVLREILGDPDVTRLSVVSHSQGTIIAVDVFSRAGMTKSYRDWLVGRLEQVGGLNLVTMGSPLTHLYQHYFPERYDSLATPGSWDGLKDSLNTWVNVYRIDDYIGTFVEWPVPGLADPNRPIHAGGHTAYWDQPAVFKAVRLKQAGALPG